MKQTTTDHVNQDLFSDKIAVGEAVYEYLKATWNVYLMCIAQWLLLPQNGTNAIRA